MKVLRGQTLFDIAIQTCGTTAAAFELAILNGVSLTDDIATDMELSAFPSVANSDVVDYYQLKNLQSATLDAASVERNITAADSTVDNNVHVGNYVRVLDLQTVFDIAIQESGSIEAAMSMAILNGISISDTIEPGTLLQKVEIINKRVANYYGVRKIMAATGYVEHTLPIPSGIFDYTFNFTFS